ncbi:MAG: molybdenum cofactor biosynthesis protein MoaE [Planctomycetes bacterium]|nr:molybdenum cofactor biosynthesis protein MoaE [Planctomycetota bacterium]
MMKIRVRVFAMLRERLGTDQLELELPDGTDVDGAKRRLSELVEGLAELPLAVAVDREYAAGDRVLRDGDELALIPPISGGATERLAFRFVAGPLEPRPLEAECRTDHDGAVVTFAGVTRDHNDGERVRGLAYEAYREMAEPVMARILADVGARHAIGRVRVEHRLGEVPIGEASVIVVVAAAHRGPAFEACREIMDRLKAEVPIFKKEWLAGDGGGSRWVGELPRTAE